MAVFPDKIILKRTTDSDAAVRAAIESGGTDEIVSGELVMQLFNDGFRLYCLDSNNDVVALGTEDAKCFVDSIPPTVRPSGTALEEGDMWFSSSDSSFSVRYNDAWVLISGGGGGGGGGGAVSSVNGQQGDVVLKVVDMDDYGGEEAGVLFDFDEGDGSSATYESTGNLKTALTQNSVQLGLQAARYGASGWVGGDNRSLVASSLEGTEDEDLFKVGTGDFTLETWINLPAAGSTTNVQQIFGVGYGNTVRGWVVLRIRKEAVTGSDSLTFTLGTGESFQTDDVIDLSNDDIFTYDIWHHIAFSRHGDTVRAFVDGIEIASGTSSVNIGSFSYNDLRMKIGENLGSASDSFYGFLDNLYFVNGQAKYTSNFTPGRAYAEYSPPADGSVLTWSSANSKWEAQDPAVSSVNDQTGDVSLGIKDMNDYYASPLGVLFDFDEGDGSNVTYESTGNLTTALIQGGQLSSAEVKYGASSWAGSFTRHLKTSSDIEGTPDEALFKVGTEDFTLEAWVYLPTGVTTSYQDIFNVGPDPSSSIWLRWSLRKEAATGDDTLTFTVGTGEGGQYTTVVNLYGLTLYAYDTWHHVAFARHEGTIRAFVDGAEVASVADSTDIGSAADGNVNMTIGATAGGTSSNFYGYLDNLYFVRGVAKYVTTFTPGRAEAEKSEPEEDGMVLAWSAADSAWTPVVPVSGGGGGGGGGSTGTRLTQSETASGGAATFDGIGHSGVLVELSSSLDAWVVLYGSDADRVSDAGRAYNTDPAEGSGVLAEFYITSGSTVLATPGTTYFNNDSTMTEAVYAAVRSQAGADVDSEVTITAYGNQVIQSISGGTFGSG